MKCKPGFLKCTSSNLPYAHIRHLWASRSRRESHWESYLRISSSSAICTVPPEFSSEQPLVVQAVEHGAVQLPLLVSASPPDITYRWTFLGEVLLTGGSSIILGVKSQAVAAISSPVSPSFCRQMRLVLATRSFQSKGQIRWGIKHICI